MRQLASASLIAILSLALLVMGPAMAQQQDQNGQNGEQIQLSELLNNTDEYTGDDVTVSGPVGEEIDRNAFTLSENGDEILVVGDDDTIPSNVPDNAWVSGAVQESFDVSDIEDELGVNLNNDDFSDFEDQPYITADQVQEAQQGQNGDQVQLSELLDNTDEYTGQDVTVSGSLGEEIDRNAFTLSQDGDEILVVGDDDTIPSNIPDNVWVSGAVHESFDVSDVEDELGVNLNNNDFADFEDEPFIMADQVQEAEQGQQDQAEQVSLQELTNNARDYNEQRVEVSGNLESTPLPAVYRLSDGNNQVIVLANPNNVPSNLQGQDDVAVTGTAFHVSLLEFVNTFDLNSSEDDINGVPNVIIFADQVGEGQQEQQGDQVQLGELLDNTDEYAGEDVTVSGSVGEDLDRNAFTVSQNGEEILVVGDDDTIPSNLPDNVQVSGAVQESFDVSDVEDELGIGLNNNEFSDYEDQPYIMADQVQEAQQ